jgi:NADP-dependent 3-hydroxy acid dehydrogenase YdfG
MYSLKRTVLVTGASSGIGEAITEKILHLGHQVIGISRNPDQIARNSDSFFGFSMDFSKPDKLSAQLKILKKQYPDIDAIIFSAGIGLFGNLEQFSHHQIQNLLAVNFTSQVFLTREFIPELKKKSFADLIYIGSEAALKGARQGSIYCASKFALRGFTQALREECAKNDVRVSLINPGMVKTDFFEQLSFEPGDELNQHLLAEDIADAVAYILNARPGIVIDEINLNPANKVVRNKSTQ